MQISVRSCMDRGHHGRCCADSKDNTFELQRDHDEGLLVGSLPDTCTLNAQLWRLMSVLGQNVRSFW